MFRCLLFTHARMAKQIWMTRTEIILLSKTYDVTLQDYPYAILMCTRFGNRLLASNDYCHGWNKKNKIPSERSRGCTLVWIKFHSIEKNRRHSLPTWISQNSINRREFARSAFLSDERWFYPDWNISLWGITPLLRGKWMKNALQGLLQSEGVKVRTDFSCYSPVAR